MKKISSCLLLVLFVVIGFAQNVGIGTPTPTEKLDVNGNLNVGGTIKLNGVAGQVGEIISANGATLAWAKGIYTLSAANYAATSVPVNNYVRIDGNIVLSADYTGLNNQKLFITGGSITGNGTAVLSIGFLSTITGTYFTDVDINATGATFINCSFSGSAPRVGNNCKYINCQFSGLTLTSAATLGNVFASSLQSCTIPKASEFLNTELISCTIGNGTLNNNSISIINHCTLLNSRIYVLQSDFVFSNNNSRNSKILLGNATQSANYATISNNLFTGSLPGDSATIKVNPSSAPFRLFIINNNSFSLQSSTLSAIDVSLNDGNPFANSRMSVQYNTFWNSITTLSYSSNMRINYSYNTVYQTGNHPVNSGNLVVNNNLVLF